uniref:LRRNT domain-containing protein n=1 Tax=Strigops habroptila TaxID=2489341 RepID=A0A672VDU3_STRHB
GAAPECLLQVLDAVADVWLVMFFPVIFLLTRAAEAGLSLNLSASCPSMCKCAPEEIIHCNRTGLRALPGEIATSTISLNLSNNYLLWLDGNNLTFLGLLNLISLDLSHCNIFEIHPLLFSHLPSLERLDLASNNMRYVPQAFRNLSSLTKLSLEGNHIEAIGRDSLKDVESLYELNLRKNRIWIIQNGAFTKLLRLGMLNLGHNFIADLPNQLFDGLTQLKTIHLEANRITAVACTFRHLLNLRNLYLNNNQISSISDSAFLYLNKLHFLHLSKNNLSSLPSHLLAELPKLKYVFLSHNPWKCDCRMLWFWRWTYGFISNSVLNKKPYSFHADLL